MIFLFNYRGIPKVNGFNPFFLAEPNDESGANVDASVSNYNW